MRRVTIAALSGVLALAVFMPVGPVAAAPPTKAQCEKAWYEWQYFSLAPGFPVTLTPKERNRLVKECRKAKRMPGYETQLRLTQKAFNTTAQILEREIRRVSIEQGDEPCIAIEQVLKPVGPNGKPLGPRDNVEGYAADSFLPITKYNWYGGPFRLKFGVGCGEPSYANLWFLADPYPPDPDIEHPDRYPSDAEVKKDPWPRTPVEGAMSTCISWGPGLKNDSVGGAGFIFAFNCDRTNLPNDVRSCYPKAMGEDGLDRYPFKVVPNLPL
ncbi:MAG: hypothetical protein ACKOT0_02950 [bacterium]